MEKIFLGVLLALALCVFLEVALLSAATEVRVFGWLLVAVTVWKGVSLAIVELKKA